MSTSMSDSILCKSVFSCKSMDEIFSEENTITTWLETEAALAYAQGKLGVIPKEAADEICKAAKLENVDRDQLKKEFELTGHPFIPFVKNFTKACGEWGKYVHWGTTTQDMMDTALVLQIRQGYNEIYKRLAELKVLLKSKAEKYRYTIMMGRTNGQHALPITLGFKYCVWLAEVNRHMERLTEIKNRLFTGQFSGAVGTLASLSEKGMDIRCELFKKLELNESYIAWFASRDVFAELASSICIMASTLGKIGNEVYLLQKQEFSELEEYVPREVAGSSTMPHKKNPFIAMQISTLSKAIKSTVMESFDALYSEHERDPRCLSFEYDYIARLFSMSGSALEKTLELMEKLIVKEKNMLRNINYLNGTVFSESVMMKLGTHIGRSNAHELLHELAMESIETNIPLKELLVKNQTVIKYMSVDEIDECLKAENYLGLTQKFIDNVIGMS